MRKMIMAAAAACFFVFPGMADEPGCDELSTVRSAAEQGNAMAMAWLGSAYYTGVCVGQDYGKAVSMFRTAAEKGNAMAQLGIGVMYLQGQGVEQNSREAFKWLLESAESGNDSAQFAVGGMYLKGEGVDRNDDAGWSWMGKSCDSGNPNACTHIARARFIEVTTAAGPIKQQVELCFFDLGALKDAEPNPDTGATSCSSNTGARSRGTGWNLGRAVRDTQSVYVQSAEVRNGVITMRSKNIKVNGQEGFTEILVPRTALGSSEAGLNWSISPESTCKQAGLC